MGNDIIVTKKNINYKNLDINLKQKEEIELSS